MAFIKKHKVWISLVLVVAILAGTIAVWLTTTNLKAAADGQLFGSSELAPVEDREFLESDEAPEGMKLAADNGKFALFINETNAVFAILDRTSGKMWYSNPLEVFKEEDKAEGDTAGDSAEGDATADEKVDEPAEGETTEGEETEEEESNVNELNIDAYGDIAYRLKSQITLEYYDANQNLKMMNSFFSSIEEGNFTIEPIANGFRTKYTIGKIRYRRGMVPQVLSVERFEQLRALVTNEEYADAIDERYTKVTVAKLSPARQSLYTNEYPNLDINQEYYILNINTPEYAYEPIYKGFFDNADYTQADLEADNTAANIETEIFEVERVMLPLEITVTEDGFKANIPMGAADIPAKLYIKDIYLLEFFGCASTSDKGYMFLPDGSGTIVNLNNGKIDVSASASYGVTLYGEDTAIKKTENIGKTTVGTMPIFAMSVNNDGFWTVIENGDAMAKIISQTAGNTTNYNRIYASLGVQPVDIMVIKTNTEDKLINRYQQQPYAGAVTLAYNFMPTGETEYDDVARYYRDYLIKKGELKKSDWNYMPFLLELVGNIDVEKNFAGIPYESTETLTSFDEASTIINELKAAGIGATTVKYSSWFNSSQYTMTDSAKWVSGIGGADGYNALKTNVEGNGGKLYLNTTLQNVHLGLGKFNNIFYGVRHTYNETVTLRDFHPSQIIRDKEEEAYYLLSTRFVKDYLAGIVGRVKELGSSNLWLEDYANQLYSDFSKNENIVRQESINLLRDSLEANGADMNLAFDAPYSYMFKYLAFAGEIPTASSGHQLSDATVPFYSIVISGSVPATGQVINLAGNVKDEMLKAVETGTGLSFKWIYEENTSLREMEGSSAEKMYSLNYKEWIDTATEFYKDASVRLEKVWGKAIVGHSILANNVTRTDWENGVSAIVNYNETEVTVGEYTIPANDYLVING